MMSFKRLVRAALAACVVLCVSLLPVSGSLRAQTSVLVPAPWPTTWGGCSFGPTIYDGFQILFDSIATPNCNLPDAALRISIGGSWASSNFLQLGVVDSAHRHLSTRWFSEIAPLNAAVLRSSSGDLVLAANTVQGSPAIRFSLSPNDSAISAEKPNDQERMALLGNGNVGIDIPPDLTSGLFKPLDQIQIGGGVVPYPGNPLPTPGLTISGGSPLENTPMPGGGLYPSDWRYIAFNGWIDHTDSS